MKLKVVLENRNSMYTFLLNTVGACFFDDGVFFSSIYMNGLFFMDLKNGHINYLGSVENYSIYDRYLFSEVLMKKPFIIFCPFGTDALCFYDIRRKSLSSFSVDKGKKIYTQDAVILDDCLYLVSDSGGIYIINIYSKKTEFVMLNSDTGYGSQIDCRYGYSDELWIRTASEELLMLKGSLKGMNCTRIRTGVKGYMEGENKYVIDEDYNIHIIGREKKHIILQLPIISGVYKCFLQKDTLFIICSDENKVIIVRDNMVEVVDEKKCGLFNVDANGTRTGIAAFSWKNDEGIGIFSNATMQILHITGNGDVEQLILPNKMKKDAIYKGVSDLRLCREHRDGDLFAWMWKTYLS